MRKTRLSALMAATILAVGMLAGRAAAMPFAAPAGVSAPVEKVAVLCGGNGCLPVQTKRRQHKKFMPLGYTKPLSQNGLPQSTAPQSTLPSKL